MRCSDLQRTLKAQRVPRRATQKPVLGVAASPGWHVWVAGMTGCFAVRRGGSDRLAGLRGDLLGSIRDVSGVFGGKGSR
jgi:hypothetical protein